MAGYILNRIPESQRVFSTSVPSLWTSSGTTLSNSALVSRFANEGSIVSSVSSGDIISFNKDISTGLPLSDTVASDGINDDGNDFIVDLWIKSDKALDITFTTQLMYPVSFASTATVESHSETVSITSSEWVLFKTNNLITDPDDNNNYPISFTLTIDNVNGGGSADIYISHPTITGLLDFSDNPAILDIYTKLPEFIRSQDSLNTPYPWTLARFIEMCIIHQGEMVQILDDMIYSDISEGKDISDGETLSAIVAPSIAPRKYLFWMAQFTGTKLINPTTGITPWANLPSTWQGIDLLDGVDEVDGDDKSPWSVIQDSHPEPAGLDEFLRWQVSTGFYGQNAGSTSAIIESVKRVTTDTQTVNCITNSPWNINVQTKFTETPDSSTMSVGDSVSKILELIEPARPLGVVVTHELIA